MGFDLDHGTLAAKGFSDISMKFLLEYLSKDKKAMGIKNGAWEISGGRANLGF
jgi:hypothetical protein